MICSFAAIFLPWMAEARDNPHDLVGKLEFVTAFTLILFVCALPIVNLFNSFQGTKRTIKD